MKELLQNAFTSVNIIPTMLLGLVLLYWITVIIGVADLDIFDFDVDIDTCTSTDGLQEILAFFNIGQVPLMVIISIMALVFWILAMLIYMLPVPQGGLINVLLLIPALLISLLVTKVVSSSLRGIFKRVHAEASDEHVVIIGQVITLLSDVNDGRLGQGEINRDGASILINVKAKYDDETFKKFEEAYVSKKDDEKNIYYIIKIHTEV